MKDTITKTKTEKRAMKIRQLIISIIALLLTTGNVYAGPEKSQPHYKGNNGHHYAYGLYKVKVKGGGQQGGPGSSYVVPEIDAASGTSALALLTGILLLAGERGRSKRESDDSNTDRT
jgi:hypothetical protein